MTETMKHVDKVWGHEVWLVNEPEYCGKLLYLRLDHHCSYHRHLRKKETFIVRGGTVQLEIAVPGRISGTLTLQEGQSFTITPGTWHRFYGVTDAEILEVSTHHDDEDVVRLAESGVGNPLPN